MDEEEDFSGEAFLEEQSRRHADLVRSEARLSKLSRLAGYLAMLMGIFAFIVVVRTILG